MSKIVLAQLAVDPPAPAAGQLLVFARNTDVLIIKDDTGNTIQVGVAAAGVKSVSAAGGNVTNGEVVFSNSNGISFGANASTITAKLPQVSYFENFAGNPTAANSAATNSAASNISFQVFSVPFQIQATRLDYLGHLTVVGSTNASSTMRVMVYTMNGSTAGSSFSASMTMSHSSGTATNSAAGYGGQSGTRWRSMSIGTWNLTPGQYGIAFMHSLNGAAGTTGSMTIYGKSAVPILAAPGGGVQSAYWGQGLYTAATSSPPTSLQLSQLNQTAGAAGAQPYFRLLAAF
jgi:hypothetical protein